MNWKWLLATLFFFGSFLTVFKLLSYNPTLPSDQGANLYFTSLASTSTSKAQNTTIPLITSKSTENTTSAPTLSWNDSVKREEELYFNQTGSYVHATRNYQLDNFLNSANLVISAYEQLKTRILPKNPGSHVSLIRKINNQTLVETRNYLQLLDEIMNSVWKCRSAWTTVSGLKYRMDNNFYKIFELFKPGNVALYKKIKPELLPFELELNLMEYFDRIVINLIQMSNECIGYYKSKKNDNSITQNLVIKINHNGYNDIEEILEAGKLKYHSILTKKKKSPRQRSLINMH